jgi:hypothetical protein
MPSTPPPKRKPTHAEVWKKLVDEAGEDAIAAAERLTPEEVAKQLTEAGFDLQEQDAEAEKFLEDLRAGRLPHRDPKS